MEVHALADAEEEAEAAMGALPDGACVPGTNDENERVLLRGGAQAPSDGQLVCDFGSLQASDLALLPSTRLLLRVVERAFDESCDGLLQALAAPHRGRRSAAPSRTGPLAQIPVLRAKLAAAGSLAVEAAAARRAQAVAEKAATASETALKSLLQVHSSKVAELEGVAIAREVEAAACRGELQQFLAAHSAAVASFTAKLDEAVEGGALAVAEAESAVVEAASAADREAAAVVAAARTRSSLEAMALELAACKHALLQLQLEKEMQLQQHHGVADMGPLPSMPSCARCLAQSASAGAAVGSPDVHAAASLGVQPPAHCGGGAARSAGDADAAAAAAATSVAAACDAAELEQAQSALAEALAAREEADARAHGLELRAAAAAAQSDAAERRSSQVCVCVCAGGHPRACSLPKIARIALH
jgi:hypothetical protein